MHDPFIILSNWFQTLVISIPSAKSKTFSGKVNKKGEKPIATVG